MYEDEAVIIYKNLFQVRLPVCFYAYSLGANTYEKKHMPILIGARYERLLNSRMALGGEIEYNFWNPLPANIDIGSKKAKEYPSNRLPEKESLFRFTPMMKFYMRGEKKRKNIFKGFFVSVGPSVYTTTQVVDNYRTEIAQRGVVDTLKKYRPIIYKSSSGFGLAAAVGLSHVFRNGITAAASIEGFACGDPFRQEGYFQKSIGNGTMFLNPFRFYIGYRF